MRERKWQKRSESLHRFVLEIQRFIERLPIGRLSTAEIIDLMVTNMELPNSSDTLLRSSLTIADLKERVTRYETRINNEIARSNAALGANSGANRAGAPPRNQPPTQANRSTAAAAAAADGGTRCYNCSRMGHFKGQCPYEIRPTGVCYKCWQPGHISSACQSRKRVQRLLTEVSAVQPTANEGAVGGNIDYDDAEAVAEGLVSINLVSASFRDHLNQYTGFTNFVSLFDTGSPNSFVRRSALPFTISDEKTTTNLRGVCGSALRTLGTIICNVKFGRRMHPMKLIILPDDATSMPMILGRDFLQLFGIRLTQPKMSYDRTKLIALNKEKLIAPNKMCTRVLDSSRLAKLKQFDLLRPIKPVMEKASPHRSPKGNVSLNRYESDLGPEFDMPQIYAVDILEENESNVFVSTSLPSTEFTDVHRIIRDNYLKPKNLRFEPLDYEMDIHLTTDVPFHYAPRRLSYLERLDVQNKICEMIEEGIISPSDSPYASAIVLVKKEDGSTRMCIDYRALNRLTVRDNYPLPLIDDCVGYMGGKRYFSLLDLKSRFHQVKVSERSRKFTSFVTPQGQYEFRRMPFGLKNAPAVFQRFVNRVFRDFLEKGEIIIYCWPLKAWRSINSYSKEYSEDWPNGASY